MPPTLASNGLSFAMNFVRFFQRSVRNTRNHNNTLSRDYLNYFVCDIPKPLSSSAAQGFLNCVRSKGAPTEVYSSLSGHNERILWRLSTWSCGLVLTTCEFVDSSSNIHQSRIMSMVPAAASGDRYPCTSSQAEIAEIRAFLSFKEYRTIRNQGYVQWEGRKGSLRLSNAMVIAAPRSCFPSSSGISRPLLTRAEFL